MTGLLDVATQLEIPIVRTICPRSVIGFGSTYNSSVWGEGSLELQSKLHTAEQIGCVARRLQGHLLDEPATYLSYFRGNVDY